MLIGTLCFIRYQITTDFQIKLTNRARKIVVAGPIPESIDVMIPDCLVPPVGMEVRIDLRHVVTLQLGPAADMGCDLPPPDLERALCPNSLAPTLGLQRRDYWDEINRLLEEWKSVNDSKCPKCDRLIRANMARHLRLVHTTHFCFWRCPVPACPLWFSSELNGKDHIERIHQFREGRGHSFDECLRAFGLEWFGSRNFFDQRKSAAQSLWMDLALARRSGQELHNTYTITKSPDFVPLRRFFTAAVKQFQLVFDDLPAPSGQPSLPLASSLLDTMRAAGRFVTINLVSGRRYPDNFGRPSPYACQPVSSLPRGWGSGSVATASCAIQTGRSRPLYSQLTFAGMH